MKNILKISCLVAIATFTLQQIDVVQANVYNDEEEELLIQKELVALSLLIQETETGAEQRVDKELCALFARFFDEKDTMPFSKIVTKLISILKIKRRLLDGDHHQQAKCDEFIKIFEKNKHNSHFPDWAAILKNKDLHSLMSEETRAYILSVPVHIQIIALRYKLKK